MFRFKRFSIRQDRTAMKVGTDGVLLGAWVSLRGCERRVLDIGTGTGVIALMVAQRSEDSGVVDVVVDAVEIDESSVQQARQNIADSPWADRVELHHVDIQSFEASDRYDLIVTNPPFFVDSLKCPDQSRMKARHTTDLPFRDLVASVVRLLNVGGRFALILPVAESQLFDNEAKGSLSLVRRCHLYSRADLPVRRYLSEYVLGDVGLEVTPEELTIEVGEHNNFTEEYRKITSDFYLKF